MATADMLALVEAVITKRLAGDAYESYTRAQLEFRGTPMDKLFEIRAQLRQESTAEAGGCFRLAEPFAE